MLTNYFGVPGSVRFTLFVLCVLFFSGCPAARNPELQSEAVKKQPHPPIRLLVIDDAEMSAAIERHWQARSAGEILIKQAGVDELEHPDRKRLAADVVIYPSAMIGELAARGLISPISSDDLQDPQLALQDVFSLLRLREVSWGERVYAVSLGSPVLTVYYRADIFAELRLAPPASWAEFTELARRLSAYEGPQKSNASQDGWSAVAEPLGTGWAGQVLLARAAASARHRSQYSTLFDSRDMTPLIAGPAFVSALEQLADAAQYGPETAKFFTPDDVRHEFLQGRCAIALSWPSRASTAGGENYQDFAIGFAELPGATETYNFRAARWEQKADGESPQVTLLGIDGRLGSVTSECRQPKAALNLLFVLSGNELSEQVSVESKHTTLFRESQLAQVAEWVEPVLDEQEAQQYGEVLQAAQNRVRSLGSIRIPGRSRYLNALDEAVHAVLAGKATAAEALQQAAAQWTEITTELGIERQQKAYLKSIGLEP